MHFYRKEKDELEKNNRLQTLDETSKNFEPTGHPVVVNTKVNHPTRECAEVVSKITTLFL